MALPAAIPWSLYTELAVGRGHPTLADIINRPLRQLLSSSNQNPDNTFTGLVPVNNVAAYGAVGDDATDDTAAFQAAATAAGASGGAIYVPTPPVAWRLNGTVTISGPGRWWHQDVGGVIKVYNPTGPGIKFAGVTQTMNFLRIEGLNLRAAATGYKQPLVQIGDANGITYLEVKHVQLDGQSILRDGMWLWSAFDGSINDVIGLGMGGGRLCRFINDPAINVGNLNFQNWNDNNSPLMFVVQEYYGLANNLINSLHFDNVKAYHPTGGKFFLGAVNANQPINSTTITLQAGQGANYATGDWIVVDHAGTIWTDRVASVSTDTLTLTDPNGTPFALSTGDAVVVGSWHTVLGPNVYNMQFTVPHFERVNGVLVVSSHGGTISRPQVATNCIRPLLLLDNARNWEIAKPSLTSLPATMVLLHQGSRGACSQNTVRGPVVNTSGVGTVVPTQVDGGTQVAYIERFGGAARSVGVWHQDTTVAINQSNAQITGPMQAIRSLQMRGNGSLIALNVTFSSTITAGSVTLTVFKNSVATTLAVTMTSGTKGRAELVDNSVGVPFSPGDLLDVRITTNGTFAPTTNNVDAEVEVEQ